MATDIRIPELGESITEVQIAEWRVQEGDSIKQDEAVAAVDSDKATVEIPAPASGKLAEILIAEGEDARVGDVIGRIEPDGTSGEETPSSADESDSARQGKSSKTTARKEPKQKDAEPEHEDGEPSGEEDSESTTGKSSEAKAKAKESEDKDEDKNKDEDGEKAPEKSTDKAKERKKEAKRERPATRVIPAVQKLLEEHDLEADEVEATGPGGRLLKEDVLAHLDARDQRAGDGKAKRSEASEEQGESPESPDEADEPEETRRGKGSQPAEPARTDRGERRQEVVAMSRLRRTVARRLVEARQTMAILTTFNEIDMTAVNELRRESQAAFQEKHGVKLGFMSFFAKAVIAGFREVPRLNAEVRDHEIVQYHYCDLGVAISSARGLVVPALRNAERLSVAGIEKAIAELAQRARDNRLSPEELEGGTFTISNGGVFGSLLSTPIINPPQSGVLGLHAIQDRPVARDGRVVVRPMMYVALSYDHRIVDGREAVTFLRFVKEHIENPARLVIDA